MLATSTSMAQAPMDLSSDISISMEENQYLNLIQTIISKGEQRGDRTGTGTLSIFAPEKNLKFSLSSISDGADGLSSGPFPLLTTKRVGLRMVFEELIWFLKGQTDGQILKDKGVLIWEGNGSREYLDSVGLSRYRERDLGPVYGFQWRHFGATYTTCDADYSGQGVDQLRQVIKSILFNHTDRRIILSAWNPAALKDMALPPCHMFCQFYVSEKEGSNRTLSCQLYQRSCDVGLGVPFNIASYAMLTRMLAQAVGYEAGDFTHVMGDAHIYLDHVSALMEQVTRTPRPFPTLTITKVSEVPAMIQSGSFSQDEVVDAALAFVEGYEFKDFVLEGYTPHAKIAMKMSV